MDRVITPYEQVLIRSMPNQTPIDRGQFLRGDWRGQERPIRPPWSVDEARFQSLCSGCADCIGACPEGILLKGRGGYPLIDFQRGECSFCGDCAATCQTGAIRRQPDAPPWTLRAAIGEQCIAFRGVECRACGDYCPEQAIRFRLRAGGVAQPELDRSLCSGCGACVKPCPVAAIKVDTAAREAEVAADADRPPTPTLSNTEGPQQ